jgi:hypothetical protein
MSRLKLLVCPGEGPISAAGAVHLLDAMPCGGQGPLTCEAELRPLTVEIHLPKRRVAQRWAATYSRQPGGVRGRVVQAVAGAGVFAVRPAARVAAGAANTIRPHPAADRNPVLEWQDAEAAGGMRQGGLAEMRWRGHRAGSPLPLPPPAVVVRNSRSSSRP